MAAVRLALAAFAACVASGLEEAALAESDIAAADLAAEDACHVATDADRCALSLRQLRGRQESMAVEASDPLAPELHVTGMTGAMDTPKGGYHPRDGSLNSPSGAPLHTFYMYRVTSEESYPPLNVNAGNLAGVLWYLHHEVVVQYPRKFDIHKIIRYKVQTKATTPLINAGMNFGVRTAFDRGEVTGPFVCAREYVNRTKTSSGIPHPKFCNGPWKESYNITGMDGRLYTAPFEWSKFGFFVGCNKLGSFPFPTYPVYYPDATWYSLPGACPSKPFWQEDKECETTEPGGFCGLKKTPTGQGDCTWSYEYAGEITINDLVGIGKYDWPGFMDSGKKEYDPYTDEGTDFTWWNGINNVTENARRIKEAQELFKERYPQFEEDMPNPPCDFNLEGFYKEFYERNPAETTDVACQELEPNSECQTAINWAKSDGIFAHPEWYPGLGSSSMDKEFQRLFWIQAQNGCERPC